MRALLSLLLVSLLSSAASAESVRVAVGRGKALTLEGRQLLARALPDGEPVALGPSARFEAVGPFVSDGEQLAQRIEVQDGGGGSVRLGAMTFLGPAEIVAVNGQLVAVDVAELERYVAAVIAREMSPGWPAAALEAQAVAARTYVLRKKALVTSAPFDVEATVVHQVYGGADALDPRTIAAAEATRGKVLTFDGQLADAFFFASCQGTTESAKAAFGRSAPYLVPVSCSGADGAPGTQWTRRMPLGRASKILQEARILSSPLVRIDVVKRTSTGRIASARLVTRQGSRLITGNDLRRALGYTELPSLDAQFAAKKGMLVMSGRGAGHGVGLCQWCAHGMASKGASAENILRHFYPGTTLRSDAVEPLPPLLPEWALADAE